MPTTTKTRNVSSLIKEQVPPSIRENHAKFPGRDVSKFTTFLQAYYQWLEQTGKPYNYLQQATNFRDVENTLEQFVQYFQREMIPSIPESAFTTADKRKFIRRAKDLYLSKGTPRSFRILFQLLFQETVSIELPEFLTLSDSDTVNPETIRLLGSGFSNVAGKEFWVSPTVRGLIDATISFVDDNFEVTDCDLKPGTLTNPIPITSESVRFIDPVLFASLDTDANFAGKTSWYVCGSNSNAVGQIVNVETNTIHVSLSSSNTFIPRELFYYSNTLPVNAEDSFANVTNIHTDPFARNSDGTLFTGTLQKMVNTASYINDGANYSPGEVIEYDNTGTGGHSARARIVSVKSGPVTSMHPIPDPDNSNTVGGAGYVPYPSTVMIANVISNTVGNVTFSNSMLFTANGDFLGRGIDHTGNGLQFVLSPNLGETIRSNTMVYHGGSHKFTVVREDSRKLDGDRVLVETGQRAEGYVRKVEEPSGRILEIEVVDSGNDFSQFPVARVTRICSEDTSSNALIQTYGTDIGAIRSTEMLSHGPGSAKGFGWGYLNAPDPIFPEKVIQYDKIIGDFADSKIVNVVSTSTGGLLHRTKIYDYNMDGGFGGTVDTVDFANIEIRTIFQSDVSANGNAALTFLAKHPQEFTSRRNFLNETEIFGGVLHQQYAYIVKSFKQLEDYAQTVKRLLHPAGTQMYAKTIINGNTDFSSSGDANVVTVSELDAVLDYVLVTETTQLLSNHNTVSFKVGWDWDRYYSNSNAAILLLASNSFPLINVTYGTSPNAPALIAAYPNAGFSSPRLVGANLKSAIFEETYYVSGRTEFDITPVTWYSNTQANNPEGYIYTGAWGLYVETPVDFNNVSRLITSNIIIDTI
jgi:hypothetical protein